MALSYHQQRPAPQSMQPFLPQPILKLFALISSFSAELIVVSLSIAESVDESDKFYSFIHRPFSSYEHLLRFSRATHIKVMPELENRQV
jgi:hypothetical protein